MEIAIKPGKYVVAVSGGVDSMVLLDMLSRLPGMHLVVAHYDHGVREDSAEDRRLVENVAKHYGLPFVYEEGGLGPGASEAQAREARYAFLRRVKNDYEAEAIIAAHHMDDLLETAILNIIRGTGRKGLSSLASTRGVLRPLLHTPKCEIMDYARSHSIKWHEDSTNQSDQYLRNYVRHHILPKLGDDGRARLYGYIERAEALNPEIDAMLLLDLQDKTAGGELDRRWFIMLPYDVSCEVMAMWLRVRGVREFDRKTIERLVVFGKVAFPGKLADIDSEYWLKANKNSLGFSRRSLS
ncbi:MAG TPA: tRNA lysidine(34) synthetase TilS [Candidatus Saccharimonadales bacterium]